MPLQVNTPKYGNVYVQADTFADLRTVSTLQIQDGYAAIVKGGASPADGLGGLLTWIAGSTAADDNHATIAPNDGGPGRWTKIAVGQVGPIGPVAGNVMSVGPASALPTTSIALGTDVIETSGPTRGRFIADSTMTDADVANYPGAIIKTANGRYFRRDLANINVRQFGAVADGVTDDRAAFVAAIQYVQRFAVNQDGGVNEGAVTVRVPAGTYFWSNTIQVKNGTFRFQGEGQGKNGAKVSRILLPINTTALIVERHDTLGASGPSVSPITFGSDCLYIDGLTFESAGGGYGTQVPGIICRGRVTFTNNQVFGFPGNGMTIVAAAGSTDYQGNANCFLVANNAFISNGLSGLYVSGSDANAGVIMSNDFSYNGRFGLLDASFLGNYVAGNHSSANGVKGYGGNTVGSSVVYLSGQPWFVMPGQATAASTTQPGTNPSVWGALPSGPQAQPSGYPTWISGIPVFEGGPYSFTNANNAACVIGNYSEGSQSPVQTNQRVVMIGNTFGSVGIVSVVGGGIMHLTNYFGAAANAGGFYANNGTLSVSNGVNGYASETITPEFPLGVQLQRSTTDLRVTYGGADANEMYRLLGPTTQNPAGPYSMLTNRLAIGIGFQPVRLAAQTTAPSGNDYPVNSYVYNANAVAGQPRGWKRLSNGTWVADANW